jgi:hypothetical protein
MKELKNYKSSNNNKILFVLPLNNSIEEKFLNECLYSLGEQDELVDLLILGHNLNNESINTIKTIIDNPTIERLKGKQGEQETVTLTAKNKINFIIEETSSDTFSKIFNESLNYANINKYEWFTVLEADDSLTKNWVKYFNLYSTEKNEYDAFVPLARQIGPMGFAGFMNEASWVDGFAEVAGIFDLNLMLRFNCVNIAGTAFKTQSLIKYSEEKDGVYKPMKESMKINYSYEFLLRMIYNDLKFYTIPRMGYDCRVNRTVEKYDYFNSKIPMDLVNKSPENGGIQPEEFKYWTDLAKKEYFFDNDRNKVYQSA